MKSLIICVLVGLSFSVHAEMFKCVGKDGKPKYQATKCPVDAKVSIIKPADKVNEAEKTASEKRARAASLEIKSENTRYEAAPAEINKQIASQQGNSNNSAVNELAKRLASPVTSRTDRKVDIEAYRALTGQAPLPKTPDSSAPRTINCISTGKGNSVCN